MRSRLLAQLAHLASLAVGGVGVLAAPGFLCWLFACGTNVDLGGTPDPAAPDASTIAPEVADLCEPCETAQTCPVGATCAVLQGTHLFCAALCPSGAECDTDDVCKLFATATAGQSLNACGPREGGCALAAPPPSVDGAVPDHCGMLEGPRVVAPCKSCDKDDSDCQANGCYGGWWCNTTTNRCQRPPGNCP